MKTILFISRWYPFPPNNGAKLRIYNLLKKLLSDFEIVLISFDDQPAEAGDASSEELKNRFKAIYRIPYKPFHPNSFKSIIGYLSPKPRSVFETYSQEMAGCIRSAILLHEPDLVIASQFGSVIYYQNYRDRPAIMEEVEIGLIVEKYLKSQKWLGRIRNGLTWWKLNRYLKECSKYHQFATVVSTKEQAYLRTIVGDDYPIRVVPNCIDIDRYSNMDASPKDNTLVFTGSFDYYPNYEAMTWFLENVYPALIEARPEIHLTITGNHNDQKLPMAKGVSLTGYVDDVRPYVAQSWISIVPIQSGGGTRLKILEAMALRTPVVSTSKGAEGLDVKHGDHILIADTPQEFAAQITRLMDEPGLRERITANALDLVQNRYNWSVVLPSYVGELKAMIAER